MSEEKVEWKKEWKEDERQEKEERVEKAQKWLEEEKRVEIELEEAEKEKCEREHSCNGNCTHCPFIHVFYPQTMMDQRLLSAVLPFVAMEYSERLEQWAMVDIRKKGAERFFREDIEEALMEYYAGFRK